ncbi:unnamed protein product [Onchocerca flexuosa]|uniref:Uncharacterized protein n=1 Tax=Onchocerca flexuosa TaxID=387005 RepID=A0A183HRJ6_9BILA|nr:unnamed protein product [Onchocerca flexuosa]
MDNDFIEQLRAEKFEFGICELFMRCGYALFQKINIENHVTTLAFNLQEVLTDTVGVSSNPSFLPSKFRTTCKDEVKQKL